MYPPPRSLTFTFSVYSLCCISSVALPSSPFIIAMLISDIRMKARGVGLPKSQSAAGGLAQHTNQHPGITGAHVHTDLIHCNHSKLCCVNF